MADTYPGEFPPSIGNVARQALAAHGITRYDQLPLYSTAELLAIHGVGPKAVRILTEELGARGLVLKESR